MDPKLSEASLQGSSRWKGLLAGPWHALTSRILRKTLPFVPGFPQQLLQLEVALRHSHGLQHREPMQIVEGMVMPSTMLSPGDSRVQKAKLGSLVDSKGPSANRSSTHGSQLPW